MDNLGINVSNCSHSPIMRENFSTRGKLVHTIVSMTSEQNSTTTPTTDSFLADASPRAVRKQLAAIAIPTLGQLIAEPIFILADTAFVGTISDTALAGLSIGSTIILTSVGLCLFLAYSTTSRVSILMGSGRTREGLKAGTSGMWLATLIGAVLTLAIVGGAYPISYALGARGAVLDSATVYVHTAGLGITETLIAYAANGMFRGLRKANITLWSAVAGAVVNILLDALFIFVFHWGVAGSGIATGIAQWLMCAIVVLYLLPILRRHQVTLKPDFTGVKESAGDGLMLFVRTAALRVGMVATIMVATAMGTRVLASFQVINSSWNLALNVLDAIGVGGQALVGAALGAKNIKLVHSLIKEIERAGIIWGAYVGLLFAIFGYTGAHLFTTDAQTAQIIAVCAVVVGIFFPYHGWLWALDGVLIGAGDFTYLAKLCSVSAVAHIVFLIITFFAVHGASELIQAIALWLVFNIVFMGIRGIGNINRAHTDTWIRAAIED